MSLGDEIKLIRQKSLLTQGAFADELHVALSTVNRWEKGKARPNLSTMKTIKWFCEKHNLPFAAIEDSWLKFGTKEKQ